MQAAIDVRAISQRVRSGVTTLRGVSLTVGHGELVAIIGASGSGKTTLLDAMCGLKPPASGSVIRSSGNVGYVPQDDIIPSRCPSPGRCAMRPRCARSPICWPGPACSFSTSRPPGSTRRAVRS